MNMVYLQKFLELFNKTSEHDGAVVVCPDGDTYEFGNAQTDDPLMLFIKDMQMTHMFARESVVGLEKSYIDGYWDCNNIPRFLSLSASLGRQRRTQPLLKFFTSPAELAKQRGFLEDARRAESLSLEFYAAWLDPSLCHGIAQFRHQRKDPLYIAQQRRLQADLAFLQQQHAISVLDTHGAWGAFAEKACLHHDVSTSTLTSQHAEFCKSRLENIPFPVNYQIKTSSYAHGRHKAFDAAVGILPQLTQKKHWQKYIEYIQQHIADHGVVILQCVFDDVLDQAELNLLLTRKKLRIVHQEHINMDAAKTYRYWLNTFSANMQQLRTHGFSDAFLRQWKYYLSEMAFYFSHDQLQARHLFLEKI